jgi:Recombination endonuclease VII
MNRAYRLQNLTKTKWAVWRSNLKRKYNLTEWRYWEILDNQDGYCAICNTHASWHNEKFAVDHDHRTGEVRGLLCRYCNLGLGNFRDDPALLRNALRYLEDFNGKS